MNLKDAGWLGLVIFLVLFILFNIGMVIFHGINYYNNAAAHSLALGVLHIILTAINTHTLKELM